MVMKIEDFMLFSIHLIVFRVCYHQYCFSQSSTHKIKISLQQKIIKRQTIWQIYRSQCESAEKEQRVIDTLKRSTGFLQSQE